MRIVPSVRQVPRLYCVESVSAPQLGLSSYATICTNFAVVHGLVSLQWVWGDCALISRSKEGARPPQHAYATPFES